MASIDSDGKGRWRIRFTGVDKRRRAIRLSGINRRDAQTVQHHVEQIIAAATVGNPPPDATSRWLNGLNDTLRKKLAAAGLSEVRSGATLGDFLAGYFAKRDDVKPSTLTAWGHAKRNLLEFFGEKTPMRKINAGQAEDWARWLRSKQSLSEPTACKRAQVARQFFRYAVRHEIIDRNPFEDIAAGNVTNREKDYFVTLQEAAAVLDACPDAEWRLLFALSRYAGLRCPSEHLALRWEDINWQTSRMVVTSPKTEHHPGGGSRVVPIFPQLRPYLEDAQELAASEYVISRYRRTNANLRTTFKKIVKRAGLKPWPKLFHNLRATRQTELAEQFPSHVVCEWIGNTEAIARKHYLQVTDDHFNRAATQVDHNVAHTMPETRQHTAVKPVTQNEKTPGLPGYSGVCREMADGVVGAEGLEPPTLSV